MLDISKLVSQYDDILKQLENHQIPEMYPDNDFVPIQNEKILGMGSTLAREKVIRLCGYCFLSYNWIRPLAAWIGQRKCLEIMCGSGAFSYALKSCGVDVISTDDMSWINFQPNWFQNPWTEIEKLDCVAAIRKYSRQTDLLICSWPYIDDACYQALLEMRKVNPKMQMLFIGEINEKVNASKAFFDEMHPVNDHEFFTAMENFRSAYSFHDRPLLIK